MKLDYKKILKVLGTGVGAIAVAWAGAGFPVALGLSGLVDNTGKLAGMFAIEATNVATGKASAAGGYQVKGDNRPITIPAAQIVDYIKARQQSAEVQGHMQNVAAAALNGDERIHNIASAFMAGDDDGDAAADYIARLEDEAA